MGIYYHQHCSSSHQSPRSAHLCCCWSIAHQHCSSSLLLVIGLLINLLINTAAHEPLVNLCCSSSSFFTAATLYGLLTAYQVINLQCLYSYRCTTIISSLSYLLLNHSTSSCHALVDVTRKQVIKEFVHLGLLMSSTRVSESVHQVCNIISIKAYQACNIIIGYASLSMHHHHSLFIIEYQGSITSLFTCTYCTIIII